MDSKIQLTRILARFYVCGSEKLSISYLFPRAQTLNPVTLVLRGSFRTQKNRISVCHLRTKVSFVKLCMYWVHDLEILNVFTPDQPVNVTVNLKMY